MLDPGSHSQWGSVVDQNPLHIHALHIHGGEKDQNWHIRELLLAWQVTCFTILKVWSYYDSRLEIGPIDDHKSWPTENFPRWEFSGQYLTASQGRPQQSLVGSKPRQFQDTDDSTSCPGPQSQRLKDFSDLSKKIYINLHKSQTSSVCRSYSHSLTNQYRDIIKKQKPLKCLKAWEMSNSSGKTLCSH